MVHTIQKDPLALEGTEFDFTFSCLQFERVDDVLNCINILYADKEGDESYEAAVGAIEAERIHKVFTRYMEQNNAIGIIFPKHDGNFEVYHNISTEYFHSKKVWLNFNSLPPAKSEKSKAIPTPPLASLTLTTWYTQLKFPTNWTTTSLRNSS